MSSGLHTANAAGILRFLTYLGLVLASLAMIVPILVVFFTSFKTAQEYATTGAMDLPASFANLDNFLRAFVEGNMLVGFGNTMFIMTVSLAGTVILGAMAAYVISRFRFKGRGLILMLFLFATLVPAVTTQVATFKIVNFLGLYNTRAAGIVLFMGTDIISIYIFLQFLDSIPTSLDESGLIEGASYLTIFRKIILPLLSPAITTILIIKGVGAYNNFYTPFLYMPKTELQMVSTALFKFQGPYGSEWQVISAAIIIATIPTLIIFLTVQRYIYNGFTAGAVK